MGNSRRAREFDVRRYGAVGDGSTDDRGAIQAAIGAAVAAGGGTVHFPAGTYAVRGAEGVRIAGSNVVLRGSGPGQSVIQAHRTATMAALVTSAPALAHIGLEQLTVDANGPARAPVLGTVPGSAQFARCVVLARPTDAWMTEVVVTRSRGSGAASHGSAVGFASSGGSRVRIENCQAISCGDATYRSDGFYSSSDYTMYVACHAVDCFDTGFVLEKTSHSGIVHCSAIGCGAGGGITNAQDADARSNFVDGLTIDGWNAPNTGGFAVGTVSTAYRGNLYDTVVKGVVMRNGKGPGIYVRSVGAGKPVRVLITHCIVDTSTAQGILVNTGQHVVVTDCLVDGTAHAAAIQVNSGSSDVLVENNTVHAAGVFGLYCTNPDRIVVRNNRVAGTPAVTKWGMYFAGKQVDAPHFENNVVTDASSGAVGTDAGVTVITDRRFESHGAGRMDSASDGGHSSRRCSSRVGHRTVSVTRVRVLTARLVPSPIGAHRTVEQEFRLDGLSTKDRVRVTAPEIGGAVGIAGAYVPAANVIAIRFVNPTGGPLVPMAGIYTVIVIRD